VDVQLDLNEVGVGRQRLVQRLRASHGWRAGSRQAPPLRQPAPISSSLLTCSLGCRFPRRNAIPWNKCMCYGRLFIIVVSSAAIN